MTALAGCAIPCTATGAIRFRHPSWGQVTLITFKPDDADETRWGFAVVDDAGHRRYRYLLDYTDAFEPAGPDGGDGPGSVPAPIDRTGNLFFNFDPGNVAGVIVLRPVRGGFDSLGSLPPEERFASAAAIDDDHDGVFEIEVLANDCDPDCASGTTTAEIYRWNGATYSDTGERHVL